jgi:hypothetical protein
MPAGKAPRTKINQLDANANPGYESFDRISKCRRYFHKISFLQKNQIVSVQKQLGVRQSSPGHEPKGGIDQTR